MIFLQLFITFFEIGLFGFGGGYAMISLIQGQVVTRYHWMSMSEFTNVIAISQMTPGPIGINSATYSGYTAIHNAGHGAFLSVLGSAISTFALILPSLILMILICKLFMKYMHTNAVQSQKETKIHQPDRLISEEKRTHYETDADLHQP